MEVSGEHRYAAGGAPPCGLTQLRTTAFVNRYEKVWNTAESGGRIDEFHVAEPVVRQGVPEPFSGPAVGDHGHPSAGQQLHRLGRIAVDAGGVKAP